VGAADRAVGVAARCGSDGAAEVVEAGDAAHRDASPGLWRCGMIALVAIAVADHVDVAAGVLGSPKALQSLRLPGSGVPRATTS
jgi:hypothetical protein